MTTPTAPDETAVEPNQAERERAFNQILLACHSITWMTAQIERVREQLRMTRAIPSGTPVFAKQAQDLEDFMQEVACRLHSVYELVGNYLSDTDMATKLDEKVTTPTYEVLSRDAVPMYPEIKFGDDNAKGQA